MDDRNIGHYLKGIAVEIHPTKIQERDHKIQQEKVLEKEIGMAKEFSM